MQRSIEQARTPGWPFWTGLFLAAVVSSVSLVAAAGGNRWELGVAVAPFGWYRMIVIHALSTLALSWWLARLLAQRFAGLRHERVLVVWAILGLLAALLTVALGRASGGSFMVHQPNYVARFAARVLWCLALQTPWCLWGLAYDATLHGRPTAVLSTAQLLLLGLIAAVGVPASFLAVFVEQQGQRALISWQRGELAKAHLVVLRLAELGSNKSLIKDATSENPAAALPPAKAVVDLNQTIQFVQQQIAQLRAGTPTEPQRLQLAQLYLTLDQAAEAEPILRSLQDRHALASLLIAQIHHEQGRLEHCRDAARQAIRLARQPPHSAHPPNAAAQEQHQEQQEQQQQEQQQEIQLQAYDLLAVEAGQRADFAEAERLLQEALEQLPHRKAEIHHRLAKHYEFVGRLADSITHQKEANRLQPESYSEPDGLILKMLATGAPIGLARPQSSRYK